MNIVCIVACMAMSDPVYESDIEWLYDLVGSRTHIWVNKFNYVQIVYLFRIIQSPLSLPLFQACLNSQTQFLGSHDGSSSVRTTTNQAATCYKRWQHQQQQHYPFQPHQIFVSSDSMAPLEPQQIQVSESSLWHRDFCNCLEVTRLGHMKGVYCRGIRCRHLHIWLPTTPHHTWNLFN